MTPHQPIVLLFLLAAIILLVSAQDDPMANHFTASPMSVDEITLTHKYSYDLTSNIAHIIVSFELQFPPSFASTEFALNHPLLDISNIDSFPKPIEDDKVFALERLYHLIHHDIYLTCGPDDTRALLTWDAPLGWRWSLQDMTASRTESIICQVDIPYPPDVLEIAFETRKSIPIVLQHAPSDDDENTQWTEQTFTLKKPTVDEFEPIPTVEADKYPVRLWRSASHAQGDADVYEFSAILTSPQTSSLSATVAIYFEGVQPSSFNLLSFEPETLCRAHHETQYDMTTSFEDVVDLDVRTDLFRGFGRTCRLRFTLPLDVPAVLMDMLLFDTTSDAIRVEPVNYTACSNMHICKLSSPFHYFPSRLLHSSPHPAPIPFEMVSGSEDDNGNDDNDNDNHNDDDDHTSTRFMVGTMDVQYILMIGDEQIYHELDLVLIFHDLSDVTDITPVYPWETSNMVELSATFGNHIPTTERLKTPKIEYTGGRFTRQLGIVSDANDSDAPQPGGALMRPMIRIPLGLKMYPFATFQLAVRIPMNQDYDIASSRIYAVLLPRSLSDASIYTPNFGLITPVRTAAPLRNYSYRCVARDSMIGTYVHTPTTLETPSHDTFPCPLHISPQTGEIDVGQNPSWERYWDQEMCFYQLLAVCVTPSAIERGAYNIHPLVDCPSLLGQVHGVPCYDDWDIPILRRISLDLLDHGEIHVSWATSDTFRLATMLQIRFSTGASGDDGDDGDDGNDGDDDSNQHVSPWITISQNLPQIFNELPEFTVMKPFFHHSVTRVQAKVVLTGVTDAVDEIESEPLDIAPPDDGEGRGCIEAKHQVLDPIHLVCVCAPGFTSDVPMGLDNPFIHPDDFTCTSLCDDTAGYTWNVEAKQCETDTGRVHCGHGGAFNPSTQRCDCFDGFFGSSCSDSLYDSAVACQQQECVEDHVYIVDAQPCFIVKYADHNQPPYTPCNCLPRFTGDRCQHERVCGDQPCVNGHLASASGLGDDCICHCNPHSSGNKCDECALPCENGGVGDDSCTQCICPVGYVGATCETPVWIHSFTLDALPKHILDLIAQDGQDVLNPLNQIQHHIVESLFNDYSDAIADGHIILGYQDGQQADDAKSIVLKVTASPLRGVISDEDPTASRLSIDIMVYPDALTPEQLAYIKLHLLEVDWTPITSQLVSFKKTLMELGILKDADDAQAALPTISDPLCMSTVCKEEEEEEDKSSNGASILFTSTSSTLFILSMPLIVAQVLWGM